MLRTIDYTQLDPDTRSYLRKVREANGRGMPGVFEATGTARPLIAFLVGLAVIPFFLWIGYSTNKAPWAAALIQTAGVILGGWLILFAIRRWGASKDRFAGKFVYFDPEHVFVGEGEELRYARLDEDTEVKPGGDTTVLLRTEDGAFPVPVPNRALALFVSDFYDALAHLRDDRDGWWSDENPATLGAMARYMVVNERVPTNLSEVTLDVDELPDEVRPARRRPSGFPRYLAVLGAFAGVFALFYFSNAPAHDAGAWAGADKTSPAALRHYLADPHTTAHHAEAKVELDKLYDAKLTEVRAKGTDPELREAFAKLLDTLRGPETPAISLGVTGTIAPLPNDGLGNDVAFPQADGSDKIRERLADGIGTAVGPEYVVFVRKPDDKPALIDLTYKKDAFGQRVWTLTFRKSPDAEAYATITRPCQQAGLDTTEVIYSEVMLKMLGNAPPVIVMPKPEDDF